MASEYIFRNGQYKLVGETEVVRQMQVKFVDELPEVGSAGIIYVLKTEQDQDVPTFTSSDAGKVLTVNNSATALEWKETKGGSSEIIDITDGITAEIKAKIISNPSSLLIKEGLIYHPSYKGEYQDIPNYYTSVQGDEEKIYTFWIDWDILEIEDTYELNLWEFQKALTTFYIPNDWASGDTYSLTDEQIYQLSDSDLSFINFQDYKLKIVMYSSRENSILIKAGYYIPNDSGEFVTLDINTQAKTVYVDILEV